MKDYNYNYYLPYRFIHNSKNSFISRAILFYYIHCLNYSISYRDCRFSVMDYSRSCSCEVYYYNCVDSISFRAFIHEFIQYVKDTSTTEELCSMIDYFDNYYNTSLY